MVPTFLSWLLFFISLSVAIIQYEYWIKFYLKSDRKEIKMCLWIPKTLKNEKREKPRAIEEKAKKNVQYFRELKKEAKRERITNTP